MRINYKKVLNKHVFRVLAIGMFAFPEPVISDGIGLCLLAVSFFLPEEENSRRGEACTCGCDFHVQAAHCAVHGHWGAGALRPPQVAWRKLERREAYRSERYGFVPQPAAMGMGLFCDTARPAAGSYSWHSMPRLEGTALRRLGGFGSSAAMRCEYRPHYAGARA